jgi:CBS domain-containing protein
MHPLSLDEVAGFFYSLSGSPRREPKADCRRTSGPFANRHGTGRLTMSTVKNIMTTTVITVGPETEIVEAARLLLENHINGLPVVDTKGKLIGILCQSDLVVQQKKLPLPSFFTFLEGYIPLTSTKQIEKEVRKALATTVQDAMTPNPVTVSPDTEVAQVAELMVDKNFHTLPVVQEGRLVGIVGKEDVIRTLAGLPASRSA